MTAKLAVTGAAGRMGRRITALAVDSGRFEITAAVDRTGHPDTGSDVGILAGIGPIGVKLTDNYSGQADVVIDFSQPEATAATVDYCLSNSAALVVGTTGLGSQQMEKIGAASEKIAVLVASNMSVGMNVLFSVIGKVAAMLGENYDIEIIEQHHRFKKDAPSGTALSLAENICKSMGRDFPGCIDYGRSGKDCKRQKGRIGMHAVRAGGIVGIHEVIFGSSNETVTVSHSAGSRDNFAAGALRAAEWLIGKKAGMYSMADCLGIS